LPKLGRGYLSRIQSCLRIWRKSFGRATPQWKLRQPKQPDWRCYAS